MRFRTAAATVIVFAAAMAYLESAVVVYLQQALSITPDTLFPLRRADVVGSLAGIEVGREAATLVMLAAIGCLAGRRWIDRLAWTAVAFGVWDIGYYFWLWLFVGWPHAPGTWDVLFLIPLPWAGPVWAPIVVSVALIGFGLAAAQRCLAGKAPKVDFIALAGAISGGVIVIVSFLANGPALLNGRLPGWYPWPVFVLGMGVASLAAAAAILGGAGNTPRSRS